MDPARAARRHRRGRAAIAGDDFADLITLDDVTTAFHCHTTYSDGKGTIAEMVHAAAELGFEAITITDHSAAASYASGLDLAPAARAAAEIAALVDPEVRILRGTEADILADGAIDVPPELIGELDVIIASVHQRYKLDEDAMTARLVAAMRQPFFKIWGHALGRLVLRRDPIDVRLDDVLDAVAESPRRDRDQRRSATGSISIRSTRARPPRAASSSCCRATPTRRGRSARCATRSRWRGARGSASATC